MIGSIGVDIQGSRAAVCLMEWAGGQVRQGPVGDGRRLLIPIAATATAWGSAAAEAALDTLPAARRPADMLYAWRQDAWSPEFLAGLHRRLLAFLGQAQPEGFRSHQVCVSADPDCAGGWATAAELLGQAGLPRTGQVDPADALLCRWLSEAPQPPSGPVLAVACGETATILGLYSVGIDAAPVVRVNGETRVDAGSGPWVTEIAADALRQCRPGFPARALVGLLDGVDEFAAMLRASTDDTWVEWAGPLSQYMFEPLRASRSEVAARPTVADYTRPVASAVHSVLDGVAGRITLLVGGPGAAWPFVADALAGLGTLWQSGDPTLDLAYGACWWERYRRSFRRDGAAPARGAVRVQGAVPAWETVPVRSAPGAGAEAGGREDGAREANAGKDGARKAGAPGAGAEVGGRGPGGEDREEPTVPAFAVPPGGTESTGAESTGGTESTRGTESTSGAEKTGGTGLPWEKASAASASVPAPAEPAAGELPPPWE